MRELRLATCFLMDMDHVCTISGHVFSILSWLYWMEVAIVGVLNMREQVLVA